MTHERTDRIRLPISEARCEPEKTCSMLSRCARYLAAISRGAPLADYSIQDAGGTALCAGFADAGQFRNAPSAPAQRVHPSIGGPR